jgi:histidine triad (HIT) family protein
MPASCHNGALTDFYCERVLNGIDRVDVVFESPDIVAFHHTRPFFSLAHVVVVPKRHLASLLDPDADALMPAMLSVVRDVAAMVLREHGAARVLTNLGAYQDSKHLHWHVYAGTELAGSEERAPSSAARSVEPLGMAP